MDEEEPIEEGIPELDEFGKIQKLMIKAREELTKILPDVKKKYPNTRMFSIVTPYSGIYIIRSQDINDVKASTQAVDAHIDAEMAKAGGREVLAKLSDEERAPMVQRINAEASDISNEICLARCVIYPYDFSEKVQSGIGIPAGVYPLLIEKIYEISGWQDVEVEEI